MSKGKFGRRFRRSFLRDQSGGILVTAALSMLPITLLMFAALEFHNFTRHRSHLQDALDAAALAVAQAPVNATQAQLRTLYTDVLKAHLDLQPGLLTLEEAAPDPVTGLGGKPELILANGRVTANATVAISPIVASFFMNGDVKVSGRSEVLREVRGVEVALVLDNTGSMLTNNRIGITKTAASNFVDILAEAAGRSSTPSAVRIGLVPFAATVNVGSANRNATWLDQNAQSPIHGEIFARRTNAFTTVGRTPTATYAAQTWPANQPNRFTLMSQIGATWSGCVESRPYPHDVRDTAPSTSTPATLVVPYFYPDEPDRVSNAHDANPAIPASPVMAVQPHQFPNSYVEDFRRSIRTINFGNGNAGAPWSNFNFAGYTDAYGNMNYNAALTDFKRYIGNGDGSEFSVLRYVLGNAEKYASPTGVDFSGGKGPNMGCGTQPVTRLTNNYNGVKTAIQAMTADGATNIPMGLVWGYHLLSPKAPFADGSAYFTRNIHKVAVLMTDGDNAVSPLQYTGLGYAYNGRAGTTSMNQSDLTTALNARMSELCTNMKNDGIVIYTVRVEVTGGDPAPMRNCATSPSNFFDVKQASDLDTTFREIARSIQNLRIAA